MPFTCVRLAKGRSSKQEQEFVRVLTEEAARILDVKPEWVTVVFDEYSRDNWATAGVLHSIKFGEGCGKGQNERGNI